MNIDWKNITSLKLGVLISQTLRDNNFDCVLVGGACVSIYSDNQYISKDLDFVIYPPVKKIVPILESLGFRLELSNRFVRDDCPFYIEFLNYPVTIGSEIILDRFEIIQTDQGKLKLLTPTDSVKDRLSAYFHWNDLQALEQAILITKQQKIDLESVEQWSINEGNTKKFKQYLKRIEQEK